MIKESIFREYDIRGVYPSDINESVAYVVGQSYGSILQEKYGKKICTVGMDNRYSSPTLHEALVKGLLDTGIDVIDLGLVTTPMFFFGCIKTDTLGIMVTASHNPKDDNGFKFSFDKLGNARGKQVYDFRDYTLKGKFLKGNGHISKLEILPYYKSLFKDNIKMGTKRIKVVVDPGNGTTALFAKEIYEMFDNLEVIMINDISDSSFPNHHPDPAVYENLEQLQKKVLEVGAMLGVAFDGDGDRVGFVLEDGSILPIDKFMAIVLRYYFPKIEDKRTLYDVKCSRVILEEAKKYAGEAVLCRTGASYTRAMINELGIPFGGEFSGHYVFNDRFTGFDSGIYAGLRMLEILSNTLGSASSLLDGINKYYNTPEIKIKTTDEDKFKIVLAVKKYCLEKNYSIIDLDGVRVELEDGWALVRASNTGPNLTLRFEAVSLNRLESLKKEFISVIEKIRDNLAK